jgi:hypothetical protein
MRAGGKVDAPPKWFNPWRCHCSTVRPPEAESSCHARVCRARTRHSTPYSRKLARFMLRYSAKSWQIPQDLRRLASLFRAITNEDDPNEGQRHQGLSDCLLAARALASGSGLAISSTLASLGLSKVAVRPLENREARAFAPREADRGLAVKESAAAHPIIRADAPMSELVSEDAKQGSVGVCALQRNRRSRRTMGDRKSRHGPSWATRFIPRERKRR